MPVGNSSVQPWCADPGGVRLRVRVNPKSALEGVARVVDTAQGPALLVRVRAVAHKGAANRAVETAVAAWLGLPRGRVAVTVGGKSRLKTLVVTGDATRLLPQIARLAAELD